jgi:hypothetical protein
MIIIIIVKKALGVLIVSKLHFHHHVDHILFFKIRLLCLIQTVTYSFSSLHSLVVLYCRLLRPKSE